MEPLGYRTPSAKRSTTDWSAVSVAGSVLLLVVIDLLFWLLRTTLSR